MFKQILAACFLLAAPSLVLAVECTATDVMSQTPEVSTNGSVKFYSLSGLPGAKLKQFTNASNDSVIRLISPAVGDRKISFITSINDNATVKEWSFSCYARATADPESVEIATFKHNENKYEIFFRPKFSERFHLARPAVGRIASIPSEIDGVNFYEDSFIALVYDKNSQSPHNSTSNCPSKDFGAYELQWCIRGNDGSKQTSSTDVTLWAKDTSVNPKNNLFSLEVDSVMDSARYDMNYLALNAIHNSVLNTLKISTKGKIRSTDRIRNQANIPDNTSNFFYKFSNQPQARLFIPRGFKFLFDSDNQVVLTTNKNILDQRTALFSNLVVTKISDESYNANDLVQTETRTYLSRTVQCKGYKFEFSSHYGLLNGSTPSQEDLVRDYNNFISYLISVCE